MKLKHSLLFIVVTIVVIGYSWQQYRIKEPDRIVREIEQLDLYRVSKSEKLADRLVEIVGPEQAITLINAANIPSGGVKHFVSHEVGASMFRRHGSESIVLCNDDGLNGCLHGLIIESISEIGFEGVFEMIKNCRENSPGTYKMCVHGAGHAFMALASYKVDQAIEMCDELVESIDDPKADIVRWCGSGLFMENVHGDHNGLIPPFHPSLSKVDIMSPCNRIKTSYQASCYLNQAGWWHQLNGSDIAKTLTHCQDVPEIYRAECADNIARLINNAFPDKLDILEKYCRRLGDPWAHNCIEASAKSYIFVGNFSQTSIEICKLSDSFDSCIESLYSEVLWQELKGENIKNWCREFDESNNYDCEVF